MFHKLKIFSISLLSFIVITIPAMASSVVGWKVADANLVQGKIYVPSTGNVTVMFTVYFYDSYAASNVSTPTLSFVLASFANGAGYGNLNILSPVYTINDADFNGKTYLSKTYAVTLSAANIVNQKIDLEWGDNPATPYALGGGTYQVTNTPSSSNTTGDYTTVDLNPNNDYSVWTPVNPEQDLHAEHDPFPYLYLTRTTTHLPVSQNVFSTDDHVPLLTINQTVYSPSGNYSLILQSDGNVVLYSSNHTVMWTTDTNGSSGHYLFFQTDGNLVLTTNSDRTGVVWAANIYATQGYPAASNAKLALQDDGNLVLLLNSIYTVNRVYYHSANATLAGYLYWVLGDTGSGNNSVSPHFHVIH